MARAKEQEVRTMFGIIADAIHFVCSLLTGQKYWKFKIIEILDDEGSTEVELECCGERVDDIQVFMDFVAIGDTPDENTSTILRNKKL